MCSVQSPAQRSGFAALPENPRGRCWVSWQGPAQPPAAQRRGAAGTGTGSCAGSPRGPSAGPAAAADGEERWQEACREGSGEGQGLHRTRQRGYFWCCVHIVLVPVFKTYCLRGLFGLLPPPLYQCRKDEVVLGERSQREDVWRRDLKVKATWESGSGRSSCAKR